MVGTQQTRRGPRLRPVPANTHDLVRAMRAGDLICSESRHRAPIGAHIHGLATLTLLLEGTFEERYPGRSGTTCLASSALYRPPEEPHADRFGREGARNLVVEIPWALLERLNGRSGAFAGVTERRDATVHLIARKMYHEFQVADDGTPLGLEGLTLELLAHLTRAASPGWPAGPMVPWLARARDLLHDRFRSRGLRIFELAGELDVHPVALARAFRARFRSTPGEYLRQLRLAWAIAELTEGPRSIAEIAIEAGFTDQSHFTRVFRRACGETPAAFRRSVRPAPGPP